MRSAVPSSLVGSGIDARCASIAAQSSFTVNVSPRRSSTLGTISVYDPDSMSFSLKSFFAKLRFSTTRRRRDTAETGSIDTCPSDQMMPRRKMIDEMCPSPTARRLITKRTAPSGSPLWTRAGTIDGLNSAADA